MTNEDNVQTTNFSLFFFSTEFYFFDMGSGGFIYFNSDTDEKKNLNDIRHNKHTNEYTNTSSLNKQTLNLSIVSDSRRVVYHKTIDRSVYSPLFIGAINKKKHKT